MTRNPKTTKPRAGAAVMAELAAGRGKGGAPTHTRGPGRPPRQDAPQRIAVLIPGELKRWLRVTAAETGRDMGDIVTDALEALRAKR